MICVINLYIKVYFNDSPELVFLASTNLILFSLIFNQLVGHVKFNLIIKRNCKTIHSLHPRLTESSVHFTHIKKRKMLTSVPRALVKHPKQTSFYEKVV